MEFAERLNAIEPSAIRELFKLLGQPGIISFAGGFPDAALFDAEGIAQASAKALSESPAAALQYGATEGYQPLREQISVAMQRKGARVAPNELIVTTGSQQAIDLIAKTLITRGDKVIVEAPTFLATIQCFRLYGAELIGAPVDAQGVDTEALEKLIQTHQPKLIYLIPTFGNPSGALMSLERRKAVLALAAKYQVCVVEDDPYGDLYFDEAPPPSLLALTEHMPESRPWLVHCGSLSKVLAPGLRIGWLIGPEALLSRATMCKQFSDAHTSTFAQVTAAQYLASGRLVASLGRAREVYAARAHTMAQALRDELGDAIRFTPPAGGLFIWAQLTGARGQEADATAFAKRALEKQVAFVPGTPFYAQAPDRATLRLSFATVSEEKIVQGVKALKQALAG